MRVTFVGPFSCKPFAEYQVTVITHALRRAVLIVPARIRSNGVGTGRITAQPLIHCVLIDEIGMQRIKKSNERSMQLTKVENVIVFARVTIWSITAILLGETARSHRLAKFSNGIDWTGLLRL